jgi:hypothetical protein
LSEWSEWRRLLDALWDIGELTDDEVRTVLAAHH